MARGRKLLTVPVLGLIPLTAILCFAGCGEGSSSDGSADAPSTPTTSVTSGSAASSAARTGGSATATSSITSAGASTSDSTSDSSSAAAQTGKVSGHVLLPQGPMAIASHAFSEGGAIPVRYTCDGADISPPLEWSRVPGGTAALFLFVLDETSNTTEGGIRWVVGDINPHSGGVAAGRVPQGGIVGRNSAGHADYGGICPPKDKSHLISVVLYALRKSVPLSAGFDPELAEEHFPGNTFASAETYGGYQRP